MLLMQSASKSRGWWKLKTLVWLAGWFAILFGIVVGAVALGLLAGAVAVLGYIAVVLVVVGVLVIAFTGSQNDEPVE